MIDIRSKEEWAEEKNAKHLKEVLKGKMKPKDKAIIAKIRSKR